MFCTQNNSQILLFKALEVTIAIQASAHTEGASEIQSYLKHTHTQINFYDTNHGNHSVLRKGNKPETLFLLGRTAGFSNILS